MCSPDAEEMAEDASYRPGFLYDVSITSQPPMNLRDELRLAEKRRPGGAMGGSSLSGVSGALSSLSKGPNIKWFKSVVPFWKIINKIISRYLKYGRDTEFSDVRKTVIVPKMASSFSQVKKRNKIFKGISPLTHSFEWH